MSRTLRAWHFCQSNLKTRYDNQPIVPGKVLCFDGEPVLCEQGLHASTDIMDALRYAPGSVICRVELTGRIIRGYDKVVATRRKCLWYIEPAESERVLCAFARKCALDVLPVLEKQLPSLDPVIRRWLETGDESMRSAAESAARAATWSAAESAAESAARSAAWSAWSAARATAAAWSAQSAAESAQSAAESAQSAAESAQKKYLLELIRKAPKVTVQQSGGAS